MARELIANVWASDNEGYGPDMVNGPTLPDDLADDFADRPDLFADEDLAAEADLVTVDLPPPPPVADRLPDDKAALLAIAEAEGVEHDRRWGAKRLRTAIEAHRG